MNLSISTQLALLGLPTGQCAPYLLAVSGGLDSMVMAHLFVQEQIPAAVAHCNFGLRGAESDVDEAFVRQWAVEHHLPFHTEKFDTEAFAQRDGVSIQMAARSLRYAFFERLRQMHAYHYTVTAHHADDSIETLLMQLGRGSGLAGMSSIPEISGAVVRPLLQYSRTDLEVWAANHRIIWREDASNAKDDYLRNRIRHHVVPELTTAFEDTDFRKQAMLTIANLRKAQTNYQWLLEDHLRKHLVVDADGLQRLSNDAAFALPDANELLRVWLLPKGFDEQSVAHLAEHLGEPGRTWSTGDWQVATTRHEAHLTNRWQQMLPDISITEVDILVRLGGGKTLVITRQPASVPLQTDTQTLLVSAKVLIWPLTVRSWQEGDQFQPFGMGGRHQKVSDYLVNLKYSRAQKQGVRLLLNGDGTPLWLMGFRPDERCRVQAQDTELVKFSLVG